MVPAGQAAFSSTRTTVVARSSSGALPCSRVDIHERVADSHQDLREDVGVEEEVVTEVSGDALGDQFGGSLLDQPWPHDDPHEQRGVMHRDPTLWDAELLSPELRPV